MKISEPMTKEWEKDLDLLEGSSIYGSEIFQGSMPVTYTVTRIGNNYWISSGQTIGNYPDKKRKWNIVIEDAPKISNKEEMKEFFETTLHPLILKVVDLYEKETLKK